MDGGHGGALVEVILRHPKVKLVANALGTPPDDVIAAGPRRTAC